MYREQNGMEKIHFDKNSIQRKSMQRKTGMLSFYRSVNTLIIIRIKNILGKVVAKHKK